MFLWKPWAPFLKSNNVGGHFYPDFQGFCNDFQHIKTVGGALATPVPPPSDVTRGEQGGTSAPGRSTLWAPNWCRNVTHQLRNVKCRRMLIIRIYKMSNVIVKSHQDHQCSQSEQLWALVTFQDGASVSSNKSPLVVWLTVASQCLHKARVANFPTFLPLYSCVTMGLESSFYSVCRVLYCACF